MKKIILLSAITAALFVSQAANAQVRVSVNFGTPAYYDPGAYYANDADYYYMPECDAYYNPVRRLYFYSEGGRWMSASCLPARFNGYAYGRGNWTRIRERSPWMRYGGYDRGYGDRGNGYAVRSNEYGNRGYEYGDRERVAHYDRRAGGYQNNGYNRVENRNGGNYNGNRNVENRGGRNYNGNGNNGNGRGHSRR